MNEAAGGRAGRGRVWPMLRSRSCFVCEKETGFPGAGQGERRYGKVNLAGQGGCMPSLPASAGSKRSRSGRPPGRSAPENSQRLVMWGPNPGSGNIVAARCAVPGLTPGCVDLTVALLFLWLSAENGPVVRAPEMCMPDGQVLFRACMNRPSCRTEGYRFWSWRRPHSKAGEGESAVQGSLAG